MLPLVLLLILLFLSCCTWFCFLLFPSVFLLPPSSVLCLQSLSQHVSFNFLSFFALLSSFALTSHSLPSSCGWSPRKVQGRAGPFCVYVGVLIVGGSIFKRVIWMREEQETWWTLRAAPPSFTRVLLACTAHQPLAFTHLWWGCKLYHLK